jgi:hypothetical protein
VINTEQLLLDLQAITAVIAAGRVLRLGLAKQQSSVLAFLSVTAIGLFVLSFFGLASEYYYWGYYVVQTAIDLSAVFVVRQLFSSAVKDYPGIGTAGRWMIYGAVSVSAITSLTLTAALWGTGPNGKGHLFYMLILHRSLQFSLAIVIVSILLFISHYPIELRRNIYISGYIFSAIFLLDAADTLVATLSPKLFSWKADMAEVVLLSVCFLTWAVLLGREELVPKTIRFRLHKDDVNKGDELLRQLESLNRTLSKVGRR